MNSVGRLITASEALLVHQEGPKASESSLLAETIPETQDIPQTPDVPQPLDVLQYFEIIIPCRTSAADLRPYPRLVDPAQLHCHSTPHPWMRYPMYVDHLERSTYLQYLECFHTQRDKHTHHTRPKPEVFTLRKYRIWWDKLLLHRPSEVYISIERMLTGRLLHILGL